MSKESWIVLLLMMAAKEPRKGARAPGGPWPPGEDNLGTHPVPRGTHPEPRRPPLK